VITLGKIKSVNINQMITVIVITLSRFTVLNNVKTMKNLNGDRFMTLKDQSFLKILISYKNCHLSRNNFKVISMTKIHFVDA
jgi:hypothetical protein